MTYETTCKYCGTSYESTEYKDELGIVEIHWMCPGCGHAVDWAYGIGTNNTQWYEDALKYRKDKELVENLKCQLAESERRRLAAIEDLRTHSRCLDCIYEMQGDCTAPDYPLVYTKCTCWEWRGIQKGVNTDG